MRTRDASAPEALLAIAMLVLAAVLSPVGQAAALPAATRAADEVAPVGLQGTFTRGPQGFRGHLGEVAGWIGSGGDPGGYVHDDSTTTTRPQLGISTPPSLAGDRRTLDGGRISFDVDAFGLDHPQYRVQLRSTGGYLIRTDWTDLPAGAGWSRRTHRVGVDRGWTAYYEDLGSDPATQERIDAVLEDLAAVDILVTADQGESLSRLMVDDVVVASSVARTVTLARSGSRFGGRVRAESAGCSRSQPVVLRRTRPGADQVVGRTTSDRQGDWSVVRPQPQRGRYHASVAAAFRSGSGDCAGAESGAVRVR